MTTHNDEDLEKKLHRKWAPYYHAIPWKQDWAEKEFEMQIYAYVMDTDWYHGPYDGQTMSDYVNRKIYEEKNDAEHDMIKLSHEYKLHEFVKPKPKPRYNGKSKRVATKIITFWKPLTLGIGLSYYSDKQGLRRMLGSIFGTLPSAIEMPNFIVKVLAVDGRYGGFNSDSLASDDGSTELVDRFLPAWEQTFPIRSQQPNAEIVHRHAKQVFTEFEKRNQYMQMAANEKCDFLLVMDSDEYLRHDTVNWESFAKELDHIRQSNLYNADIYNVAMYDVEQKYPCFRPRLFYKPEKLEYSASHRNVTTKPNNWPLRPGPHENIPQPFIEIWHDSSYRAKHRQELQKDYEYRLESLEA